MRRSSFIFMLLSIFIYICSFAFIGGQIIDVHADNAVMPEFIGYFLIDEPVGGTMKCYIDEENIPIVSRSGRAIFKEKIEDDDNVCRFLDDLYDRYPDDKINPDEIDIYDYISFVPGDDDDDSSNGLGIIGDSSGEIGPSAADTDLDLGYRYYYYAEPGGLGKIVEFRELKNDIDSVIFMINYLYEKAEEYSPNANIIDYTNNIISYVKEMNVSYSSSFSFYWSVLTDEPDLNFINYVNSDFSHGILPKEFFASFLDQSQLNVEVHGTFDSYFIRNNNSDTKPTLYLIDPSDNSSKIDLIHMFASIAGIYVNTPRIIDNVFMCNERHDLLSWAGDLQTGFAWFINRDISVYNFNSFEEVMAINGACSKADILADIDAYNICNFNLNYSNSLVISFTEYYRLIDNGFINRRYQLFPGFIIDGYYEDSNLSFYLRLESKVYYLMCIKDVLNNYENGDSGALIYNLFDEYAGENYRQERIYLCNLFIQFLLENR